MSSVLIAGTAGADAVVAEGMIGIVIGVGAGAVTGAEGAVDVP